MCNILHILFVFFVYTTKLMQCQYTSGVTSTGQTFLCLPTGSYCPTGNSGGNPGGPTGGGSNTIDPRIVTPNQGNAACPSGTTPCFGQQTTCGTRYVNVNNTGDGRADFGSYPWQAYMRNTSNAFAGSGVLITAFHVLTAAHKVYRNTGNPNAITVYMGVWNPSNLVNVESSPVAAITVHPSFVPSTLRNDIAVLTLAQPIVLGIYASINTICLSSSGFSTSFVGQTCQVSGWGQTAFTIYDAPTTPQKQVSVSIVDYNTCRSSYASANLLGSNVDTYLDQNGEICAGGQVMKDACSQDGGSPLVCRSSSGTYTLAGLVIWGKNCGQSGVYGVYVNAPFYTTWIQSVIAPSG